MLVKLLFIFCVIWFFIEVSYYFFKNKKIINKNNRNKTINNRKHIEKTFEIISYLKNYNIKKFLEGFFLGCSYKEIKRENLFSFLSWALFEKKYSSIKNNQECKNDLKVIMNKIENKLNYRFEQGFNNNISHISMGLQKVKYFHHFLCLRLLYKLINFKMHRFIFSKGFEAESNKKFTYFHLNIDCNQKKPIIFFHGISPGWITYKKIISKFDYKRPLILFNLEPYKISSFDFSKPDYMEVSNAVKSILKKHNYTNCDIIAHSFGTIVAGWLIKSKKININNIVFIDPVCFLLSLPDVASNFIYTKPKSLFHYVIRIFAARDRTIAESLFRNFFWGDNILWLENIDKKTNITVYISNSDEIIPYNSIKDYLKKNKIVIKELNNFSHAQAISYSDIHIDDILKNVNASEI